ncbi:MAG: adenosylmethionine--8-amino-7-oxononanoate transaminase [Acidaminococcaceae bacterium]
MNKWEAMDKDYIWHPFTQMQGWREQKQLVIERGEGVKLYDTEGKEYYDGISSLWVNIHGHRRPEIDEAIKSQLGKIAHSTLLGLINQPSAEFAQKLVEVTPEGLNKVFYSDDGSTAVEAAVKIAFQYWQFKGQPEKQHFINLGDSYHGDTVGAVSVGNIDVFHKAYKPLLFATHKLSCPSFYHCQVAGITTEAEYCAYCLQELETYLQEHAQQVAAMIIEPLVQAAAGMLMQPAGYIKGVRELTKKYKVLLIVDEVAVGFGRTGKMWACEHEGVQPDLMAISKGITGGYLALGATLTTDEIYNAFLGAATDYKTFYHGHSYTGNNLACAAGLAGLEIFAKDAVIAGLPPKMKVIAKHMTKMNLMPYVGEARQCGMIAGIELMQDKVRKIPFAPELLLAGGICQTARKYGLIVRNIGDVITFMPPLVSTPAEIEAMLERLEQAMTEVFTQVAAGQGVHYSDPCAF